MAVDDSARPASAWALLACCIFQAISAIGGGLALVLDPTASSMGWSADILEGSPFGDFLLPGLILLVVLGLFPLVVAYGLWRRHRWGWWGAGALGVGIIIWLATEVILIGDALLSSAPGFTIAFWVAYGLLAILILTLVLLPPVRRFYLPGKQGRTV